MKALQSDQSSCRIIFVPPIRNAVIYKVSASHWRNQKYSNVWDKGVILISHLLRLKKILEKKLKESKEFKI